MYFTVKYIDYKEFTSNNGIQKEQDSSNSFVDTNKRLLVNPDCPIGIIRDYIANELLLRGPDIATFELCTEKGTLVKTTQAIPAINGLQFLREKETYYVILSNNTSPDNLDTPVLLTPLLNRFSKEFIDFMAQQKRKSSSLKLRRSSSSKSSSKDIVSIGSASRGNNSQTTT